ncbi:magnesium transporter-like protein [Paenibacillus larvae subsp. larvae DSM 25430]|uniref:Magnesium transporter-like protein n=1 Tax=Paenibacillus larvae subsp. larvae DSM 25430 TaxID=697284 RepID=V9W6Q3_9BACL|nr:magnesium transporter-like protein [Paenibacillus larvae subsp. larvae DSM 25430]
MTNENSRLLGVVFLRELIISSPDSLMKDIMSPQIISVPVDASQSEVLQIIRKYGLFAVPV